MEPGCLGVEPLVEIRSGTVFVIHPWTVAMGVMPSAPCKSKPRRSVFVLVCMNDIDRPLADECPERWPDALDQGMSLGDFDVVKAEFLRAARR